MKNSISAKWKTESLTQKQKIYLFQNKGQQMFLRKIALTTTVTILCSAFSASAMDSQKRWIVKQNYMKKIDLNNLLFESKYVIEEYINYMCETGNQKRLIAFYRKNFKSRPKYYEKKGFPRHRNEKSRKNCY